MFESSRDVQQRSEDATLLHPREDSTMYSILAIVQKMKFLNDPDVDVVCVGIGARSGTFFTVTHGEHIRHVE